MSSIAKQDASEQVGFIASLFRAGFYKPTQGRLIRQLTFAFVAMLLVLLVYQVSGFQWVSGMLGKWRFLVLAVGAGIAVWIAFRLVNYPRFAGFLISVEAEMNKVSWPTSHTLWRASVVVIFVIFALAASLWVFDLLWTFVFQMIGIRS